METVTDQYNQNQLVNEFKAVVADAEALLKATANIGDDKLAELRVKAEETLRNAKQRMMEIQSDLVANTKAAAQATDEYVHENPWRSIGLATSLGVVIGLLISRR
ncbi:MAG: DUF883 family protein [Methylotenera sp.]|uniref:DUF883 family protein n=1 Tax=Methylotenera sp. TaxID=2051956 RepID=UPI002489500B|nr:DUF883 family protein [Methylotenera sp.]MDI1308061.1 DUF883 family protein [Methylotenera sp.]